MSSNNALLLYVLGPPSVWRRLKLQPLPSAVGVFSLVAGLLLVIAAGDKAVFATSAISLLPVWLVTLLGVVHAAGGLLALAGLLVTRRRVDAELHTQQVGWILCGVGWLGYGWAAWYFSDAAILAVIAGATLGTGSLLQAWALSDVEESARRRLRAAGREA